MQGRSTRYLTERDLRSLSTTDLLDLIQQDLTDLDRVWRERRRHVPAPPNPFAKPEKPGRVRRGGKAATPAAEDAGEELVALHRVTCCDNYLGDFVAGARVRCPFCVTWHRAGDFPELK